MASLRPSILGPSPHAGQPRLVWPGLLLFVLLGYAMLGRGWAYAGVRPIFPGEILVLGGVAWLLALAPWRRVFGRGDLLPLYLLMAWCGIRSFQFLPTYALDALRDAVLWGYGILAVVIVAYIGQHPHVLGRILRAYARFCPWFLILMPALWAFQLVLPRDVPRWPWNDERMLDLKPGDTLVHAAGVATFWTLGLAPHLGRRLHRAVAHAWTLLRLACLLGVVAALSAFNRGGGLAFGMAFAICVFFRPHARIAWAGVVGAALALGLLWSTGFSIELGDRGRSLGIEQVTENVKSVFGGGGKGDLDNTKEWRLLWWSEIVDYTLFGDYFWVGKGFGINLATVDGFQVEDDESLRSPHNGHLTFLARGGVPGLALWTLCVGFWAARVIGGIRLARHRGDVHAEGVFIFLLAYAAAFLVNATFDVFLEGPMGGVWFWSLYGVGLAAAAQYRQDPEALRWSG